MVISPPRDIAIRLSRTLFATVIPDSRRRPAAFDRTTEVSHVPQSCWLAATLFAYSEAARFVGLSIRTREKHRIYGTGPRHSKLVVVVVYRVEDLQAWVEYGDTTYQQRYQQPEADTGGTTLYPRLRQGAPKSRKIGD